MASAGTESAGGRQGLRALVIEDEFLVALQLEDDLRSAGHVVVGPFTSLARALGAARSESFDFALLDVNLNGEMIYPVADELTARGIPYIFVTGYSAADLPERFRTVPRLPKPHHPVALVREIRRVATQLSGEAGYGNGSTG